MAKKIVRLNVHAKTVVWNNVMKSTPATFVLDEKELERFIGYVKTVHKIPAYLIEIVEPENKKSEKRKQVKRVSHKKVVDEFVEEKKELEKEKVEEPVKEDRKKEKNKKKTK